MKDSLDLLKIAENIDNPTKSEVISAAQLEKYLKTLGFDKIKKNFEGIKIGDLFVTNDEKTSESLIHVVIKEISKTDKSADIKKKMIPIRELIHNKDAKTIRPLVYIDYEAISPEYISDASGARTKINRRVSNFNSYPFSKSTTLRSLNKDTPAIVPNKDRSYKYTNMVNGDDLEKGQIAIKYKRNIDFSIRPLLDPEALSLACSYIVKKNFLSITFTMLKRFDYSGKPAVDRMVHLDGMNTDIQYVKGIQDYEIDKYKTNVTLIFQKVWPNEVIEEEDKENIYELPVSKYKIRLLSMYGADEDTLAKFRKNMDVMVFDNSMINPLHAMKEDEVLLNIAVTIPNADMDLDRKYKKVAEYLRVDDYKDIKRYSIGDYTSHNADLLITSAYEVD